MARNAKSNSNSARTGPNNSTKKQKQPKQTQVGRGGPPTAVGAGYISQGPAITRSLGQIARFTNTEFITDIVAPVPTITSPVVTLAINPANNSLCPWLSRVAAGFELYRFRRLSIKYVPTCSSSTFGMVIGAFDYDSSDSPPLTKQAISSMGGSVRTNVWTPCNVAADPMLGWYYVGTPGASASNPDKTDVKMYDMAKFYFGVYNQASSGVVGELSVSYEIEFARPDYGPQNVIGENILPSGSSLSNAAGTSVAVVGSPIFTLSSGGAGKAQLTANLAGDYVLMVSIQFDSTTNVNNSPFATYQQTDPGSAQTTFNCGGVCSQFSVGYPCYGLLTALVTVVPGSVLLFTAVSQITNLAFVQIRVASYRKALG